MALQEILTVAEWSLVLVVACDLAFKIFHFLYYEARRSLAVKPIAANGPRAAIGESEASGGKPTDE